MVFCKSSAPSGAVSACLLFYVSPASESDLPAACDRVCQEIKAAECAAHCFMPALRASPRSSSCCRSCSICCCSSSSFRCSASRSCSLAHTFSWFRRLPGCQPFLFRKARPPAPSRHGELDYPSCSHIWDHPAAMLSGTYKPLRKGKDNRSLHQTHLP